MRTFWGTLWERVELASCACLRCCCTVAAGHARERERERTRERRKIERDLQKFVALPYSYSHCLFTIKLITSLRQVLFCAVRSKKRKKTKKKVATDCRVLKLWEDVDLCSYSHGKLLILLYLFLLCASFSSKPVVYFLFVAEKTPSQTLICDVCVCARAYFFFSCGGFMMGVGFEGLRRVRRVFFLWTGSCGS
jgi:hypothetical protein